MSRHRWALGLLLLSPPSWGGSPTPVPVGSQFQINSYTQSIQSNPAVAKENDGDFVVVWQSFGSGGDDASNERIPGGGGAAGGRGGGGGRAFSGHPLTHGVRAPPPRQQGFGGGLRGCLAELRLVGRRHL